MSTRHRHETLLVPRGIPLNSVWGCCICNSCKFHCHWRSYYCLKYSFSSSLLVAVISSWWQGLCYPLTLNPQGYSAQPRLYVALHCDMVQMMATMTTPLMFLCCQVSCYIPLLSNAMVSGLTVSSLAILAPPCCLKLPKMSWRSI